MNAVNFSDHFTSVITESSRSDFDSCLFCLSHLHSISRELTYNIDSFFIEKIHQLLMDCISELFNFTANFFCVDVMEKFKLSDFVMSHHDGQSELIDEESFLSGMMTAYRYVSQYNSLPLSREKLSKLPSSVISMIVPNIFKLFENIWDNLLDLGFDVLQKNSIDFEPITQFLHY
ncbi:hypothetical protein GEMRC1_000351 [Eukaryota sp. GEM-RC1]